MPFKIKGSPNFHVELRRLPGYGNFPRTSTHVTRLSTAQQMERLIRRIAADGLEDPTWYQLLDALRAGGRGQVPELTLPQLLRADREGRLDELRISLKDPLLVDAIEEYARTGLDYNTANGLVIAREMAQREFGAGCRMSVLRTGKNITLLCARAEREGGRSRKAHPKTGETGWFDHSPLSRNTVVRFVRNAISKLVAFHFGQAARDKIFADVTFSAKDDTRKISLNAHQFGRLLRACESWFRPFVVTATLTSADRAPLLRMKISDVETTYRVDLGLRVATLFLDDRKTTGRPRSVTLVGPPAEAIVELIEGRSLEEKVFLGKFDAHGRRQKLTPDRVRRAFEKARDRAGYTVAKGWHADLRFKDLRHTSARAFEKAGLSSAERQAAMGHLRRETTMKYEAREVTLSAEDAVAVAVALGLLHNVPDRPAREAT